jgi:hypothetical protein
MMDEWTIPVPTEIRRIPVRGETRRIKVPGEIRTIKVNNMTLLHSKSHTAGDTRRYTVDYSDWLDNPATITQCTALSSSADCTVNNTRVLGEEVVFFLAGGVQGEQLTVLMTMSDTDGNIKNDTIAFTVVAP